MSFYELRILKWSWGLMVDLDLTVEQESPVPANGVAIASGIWFVTAPGATPSQADLPRVIQGLRRVGPRFKYEHSGVADFVFTLHHLWYPATDSQDEAIELAVAGWAAEELKLDGEPADVTFDQARNRYRIEFSKVMWYPGRPSHEEGCDAATGNN